MGKRIIARARGKGGPRYRAPSHRYLGRVEYKVVSGFDKIEGEVIDILHDPGRSAPVALIKFDDGDKKLHIASENLKQGDKIVYGGKVKQGNVLPLVSIPEGTKIFGIETFPGSGPKLCRSSGSFAIISGKKKNRITVTLSSGKTKELNSKCLATIGISAGGGRIKKPWLKAGKKYHALKARGKLYPRTKGVAMNPVDHPFGGKTKPGISKAVSRHAPPGRKVGSIAPRRMGKKKR